MSETGTPQAPPAWSASGPSGPRASFGRRLVALLVDSILLGVLFAILDEIIKEPAATAVDIAIAFLYFGYLEGSGSGQTIGKRVMSIRVIDFNSGGPIGFGRGLLRYLARILSTIACFLGYFWMLWDKEKQTWHDKLVTTVVVPVQYYPVTSWPG
jgi:uncharacterized RDD family membrane protein YckC